MSTGRFWLYAIALAVVFSLYLWRVAAIYSISNQIRQSNQLSLQIQQDSLENWLNHQPNERKIISLAKLLKNREPALLQKLIDKAYALNPNSRDITLLASDFHPELKDKVLVLDPLYKN